MSYSSGNTDIRKYLFIMIIIISVICNGCSDDDWSDYSKKEEKVSIQLENDICRLQECKKELESICNRLYQEDMKIVHAEYVFSEDGNSYAEISMSKNYEKNHIGYTLLCLMTVDMNSNSVTNIICENGNSKRVSSTSRELDEVINYYPDEIYEKETASNNTISKLQVSYYYDRVNINGFDEDGKNILKTTKNIDGQ